jgi:hypothetical protein
MGRLIGAVCAFVGAFVICWACFPTTHGVVFKLGEFGVTGALLAAVVIGYVVARGKD